MSAVPVPVPSVPAVPAGPLPAIRPWEPAADLPTLVEVGRAADTLFAAAGLDLPPDDPTEELLRLGQAGSPDYPAGEPARLGHVLVAGRPPVGYAALTELDGHAHLAELAVHPACGRRGIGTALLHAAGALAAERGFAAITLTTFRDVPFNAPWYARHGFVPLPDPGPQLRAQVAAERAAGIAVAPRVVLIKPLT